MKRFRDELLACFGSVSIGRIDQIYAELDRTPQDFAGLIPVLWPTPDSLAGEAHCAKPEPINREIAAEPEHRISTSFSRCIRRATEDRARSPRQNRGSATQRVAKKYPARDPALLRFMPPVCRTFFHASQSTFWKNAVNAVPGAADTLCRKQALTRFVDLLEKNK